MIDERISRALSQGLFGTGEHEDHTIVDALYSIAAALRSLGTGNASSDMGAIEFLAVNIERGLDNIASAIAENGEPK